MLVFFFSSFKKLIDELFKDVVTRYMRMGAGQFLRDFRRAYQLKKTAEHRKRVLQRKQKIKETMDKVPFCDFSNDRSLGKETSYARLIGYYQKHGERALKRCYSKVELQKLCRAIDVPEAAKDNKSILVRRLVGVLREDGSRFACSFYLDRLKAVIPPEVPDGRIILRIQR